MNNDERLALRESFNAGTESFIKQETEKFGDSAIASTGIGKEKIKQNAKKAYLTDFYNFVKTRSQLKAEWDKMSNRLLLPKTGQNVFQGLKGLSTKLLEKFKGMPNEITQQQFNEVLNRAKKEGIKLTDENIVKDSIVMIDNKINLSKTAKKVEMQLVPLTPTPVKSPRWSRSGEDFIGDGKYEEIVYQSPIKTSAGDVHYSSREYPSTFNSYDAVKASKDSFPNYFSHVRVENMTDGKTRKILETQSDLMQKENFAWEGLNYRNATDYLETADKAKYDTAVSRLRDLENAVNKNQYKAEISNWEKIIKNLEDQSRIAEKTKVSARQQELSKLQPYSSNDPLAQLRTFREEVKRAAKDDKDTILIPSGETAMKIEGLGVTQRWTDMDGIQLLTAELKSGKEIRVAGPHGEDWIISEILGDGKFKAVPKDSVYGKLDEFESDKVLPNGDRYLSSMTETFDISGKIDTKHFVYKLNEEAIPREARKMGLEVTGKIDTDNGQWWKIKIPKSRAKMPVEAFGVIPAGAALGELK